MSEALRAQAERPAGSAKLKSAAAGSAIEALWDAAAGPSAQGLEQEALEGADLSGPSPAGSGADGPASR